MTSRNEPAQSVLARHRCTDEDARIARGLRCFLSTSTCTTSDNFGMTDNDVVTARDGQDAGSAQPLATPPQPTFTMGQPELKMLLTAAAAAGATQALGKARVVPAGAANEGNSGPGRAAANQPPLDGKWASLRGAIEPRPILLFWVGCRRLFHAGAGFPRRETFLFFPTRVPGTGTLGVWRAEEVDATRLAWPGSQTHGVVVELLVVADGGRRGRPMGTAVWGSYAGCEAGLEGGGANWSFGAFPLGEIPVLDDLRVANGEAGTSVAETGVAADVAAAVGGTADEGKKGAVLLLAEALKGAASAEAATPAPFILDEGMAIPGKVVARIVSKQFVDMAELLAENLTPVATLKEANPLSELVTGTRRKLRPVPDLTSWAACFAAYTIIRCSRHRDDATMMLGYMRLILQEASVFPAERWRKYDVRFRTLAAAQPGLDWSRPHGTLFPRTFMRPEAAATGTSLPARCASCGDRCHTESQCPGRLSSEPDERSRTGRGRKGKGACYDWNYRESCRYGAACRFWHECLQCGGRHRVAECPGAEEDGERKRDRSVTRVPRAKGKD